MATGRLRRSSSRCRPRLRSTSCCSSCRRRLMGLSLPLLSRGVVRSVGEAPPVVSRLYAVNTLGAAAGAAIGGWFLLGNLGFDGTVRLASSLNLIAAAAVFLLGRVAREREARAAPSAVRPRGRGAARAYLAVACALCGDGRGGARARGRLFPARRRHHALELVHFRPGAYVVPASFGAGAAAAGGGHAVPRRPTWPSFGSSSGSVPPGCSVCCTDDMP